VDAAEAACRSGKSLSGRAEEEAQLARELGVTVRELNGHPQTSVTYDASGEVVSVTVTEPRFTPNEVETLLAARRLEASRNEFGILRDVAMDPENQFKFRVVGPRRDWSAEAVRKAQEDYRRRYKDADMSTLRWSAELD
jgi:hypothetical protein